MFHFKKVIRMPIVFITLTAFMLSYFNVSVLAGEYLTINYNTSSDLTASGAFSGGVISDSSDNDISLTDFKSILTDPEKSDYISISNFEDINIRTANTGNISGWVDTINIKYGQSLNKGFSMTHSWEPVNPDNLTHADYTSSNANNKLFRHKSFYWVTEKATGWTSGKSNLVFPTTRGDKYTYTFSMISGSQELETLKKVGFTISTVDTGAEITAYYKNFDGTDASSKTITVSASTDESTSRFVSFEAPEGTYISKMEFIPTGWPGFDDLCFITEARPRPADEITSIIIEGPDSLDVPPYHASASYEYSAKVLNQYTEVMENEEVTLTLEENDVAKLVNGILRITQQNVMPSTLTLTATSVTDPSVTTTKNITINDISPYYNPTFIPHDDGTDYLRGDFVADLDAAIADPDKDIAIINFESDDLVQGASKWDIPLNKDSSKYFGVKNVGGSFDRSSINDPTYAGQLLPSSGEYAICLVPIHVGENDYVCVTDDLGDMRVTSMGLVMVSYVNNMRVSDGWGIVVSFSDGTTQTYTKDVPASRTGEHNTFFGIKAPAGHYIKGFRIDMPSRTWTFMDDLGFILEKADILPLERDYSKFTFEKVSSQNQNDIKESLTLPTGTESGCTIVWESDQPTVIDASTGVVSIPDIADYSNVKLKGTLQYGVLTKPRVFNLYVPSKLELDYRAITIPQTTDVDITLPNKGTLYDSDITWSSDDTSVMDSSGRVTRPEGKDKYVILTATLSNSSGSLVKEYGITVKGTDRDNSPSGNNGSSGSSGSGGFVAMPSTAGTKTPIETNLPIVSSVFNDVETAHWAHDSIMKLYEEGIVNGIAEKTFAPNGVVSREQYLAMLVRAFGFTSDGALAEFTDVNSDAWYCETISIAQKIGISSGYPDGSFGVGKEITREEMAVMAYRAAEAAGVKFANAEGPAGWNDAEDISEFALNAVSTLNKSGIIKGLSDAEFSPKTTATRAQAAVIICRLLEVNPVEK